MCSERHVRFIERVKRPWLYQMQLIGKCWEKAEFADRRNLINNNAMHHTRTLITITMRVGNQENQSDPQRYGIWRHHKVPETAMHPRRPSRATPPRVQRRDQGRVYVSHGGADDVGAVRGVLVWDFCCCGCSWGGGSCWGEGLGKGVSGDVLY